MHIITYSTYPLLKLLISCITESNCWNNPATNLSTKKWFSDPHISSLRDLLILLGLFLPSFSIQCSWQWNMTSSLLLLSMNGELVSPHTTHFRISASVLFEYAWMNSLCVTIAQWMLVYVLRHMLLQHCTRNTPLLPLYSSYLYSLIF